MNLMPTTTSNMRVLVDRSVNMDGTWDGQDGEIARHTDVNAPCMETGEVKYDEMEI